MLNTDRLYVAILILAVFGGIAYLIWTHRIHRNVSERDLYVLFGSSPRKEISFNEFKKIFEKDPAKVHFGVVYRDNTFHSLDNMVVSKKSLAETYKYINYVTIETNDYLVIGYFTFLNMLKLRKFGKEYAKAKEKEACNKENAEYETANKLAVEQGATLLNGYIN